MEQTQRSKTPKMASKLLHNLSTKNGLTSSGTVSVSRQTVIPENYYERPMMLNAWTQTSSDDFHSLKLDTNDTYKDVEKHLLEKIRILEESLHEIVTQINTKPVYDLQKQQSVEKRERMGNHNHNANLSAQMNEPSNDGIKYRIIADGSNGSTSAPIEIQLAEADDVNLNSSAESGRLEICLSEDNHTFNNEHKPANMSDQGTVSPVVKRRKRHMEDTGNTSYFTELSLTKVENEILQEMNSTETKEIQLNDNVEIKGSSPSLLSNTPKAANQKVDLDSVMVSIGPNNTTIPAKLYESMNWSSASIATRKLLMAIFDRQTLATHSMTGKPSPAFKDQSKPLKQMLNPKIIQDIIFAVTRKCNVSEKEVRNAITTKCADENKMMKLQMNKLRLLRERNKENEN